MTAFVSARARLLIATARGLGFRVRRRKTWGWLVTRDREFRIFRTLDEVEDTLVQYAVSVEDGATPAPMPDSQVVPKLSARAQLLIEYAAKHGYRMVRDDCLDGWRMYDGDEELWKFVSLNVAEKWLCEQVRKRARGEA